LISFRDVATNLLGVRRRAGARSHQQSPVNEPAPVLNAPWHSFLAGEWIRISAAMTLMDTNPYAPPKAVVDDAAAPLFKRRRVVVMILLMIVTFGFYYPAWFLARRAALNRLESPRKLRRWPFVANVIVFSVVFVLDFVASASQLRSREQLIGAGPSLVLGLVQLAVAILMLVQCFAIKDILEDHLVAPDSEMPEPFSHRVELSGIMTFFFQIFYLQWAINRYIVPE